MMRTHILHGVEFCCLSVFGGWQSAFKSSGTLFGPVFNSTIDLWQWQKKHLTEDADSLCVMCDPRFIACVNSRTDFYPIANADFSVSGCIDAPEWMPAGSCGQWAHAPMHAGLTLINRG